ncbi:OmpW family protein [Colwellia sp. MB02u-6]|uniref:OmpW/AlkL family protein n=1 Tax=Colwellia sp. MB02u-6 TaxID=2759824 RepID=UPI002174D184|nr:OmpW family outer membrane protein [Colwellia sp. MB02u-6]
MKTPEINGLILSALTLSPLVFANQAGDFVVRGGATMVDPASNKANVFLDCANSGLDVSADGDTQFGVNFVYFYDKNWAIELLASTPFSHDIKLHADGVTTTGGKYLIYHPH